MALRIYKIRSASLTEMTFNGSTKTIGYAANGNKTSETEIGLSDYNTVQLHQQTNIAPFGNLVRTALLQTINYTKFDRTLDITEGDYKLTLDYGPAKNRKKTVLEYQNNVVKTRYFSGNYEKTIDANGNTQEVHYIACGNGVTVAYVIDGSTSSYHYLHTDYLGSILAVSDANGNLEYEQNFDAWGRDRNPADWTYTTSTTTRPTWLYRGFTGHEHLREFTLINMNARMYDPEVGRMLAVDNFIANPNSSQDYNRYTYANNNPLMYADPSGEIAVVAAVALGAVVGAYLGGASANSTFNIAKWENNSTTWIGMGTGALIGGLSGGLGATGQLSYAISTSVAGVSIGGIAFNNTGSNYNLDLFGGSSSSGFTYNLGSVKNRKYNVDPLKNAIILPYSLSGATGGAGPLEVYEFTTEELLIAGWTLEQIKYYRETGKKVSHQEAEDWLDQLDDGSSAIGQPLGIMDELFDYAAKSGDIGSAARNMQKVFKYGGAALGIPGAYTSIRDAFNDPSPGSILKATINTGTVLFKVNPWVGGAIFLLDATKTSDKMYENLDAQMKRITW